MTISKKLPPRTGRFHEKSRVLQCNRYLKNDPPKSPSCQPTFIRPIGGYRESNRFSQPRNAMENTRKYGIPEKTIKTIKKMYTDNKIKISIEDAEFIFKSISGVKQGDNLAPVLFLFVVQAAIETMHANWSTMKIATPDLKYFPSEDNGCLSICSTKKNTPLHHNDTLYADDSTFIFLSKANLITGTTFIKDIFVQFGLEVHLG